MAKSLKVEIKKNTALRDVLYTFDNLLTTIGNRIGETFSDTVKYPALESNNGETTNGVVAVETKKLSSPVKLSLKGDVEGSVNFDGSEGITDGIILNNAIKKVDASKIYGSIDNSNSLGTTITETTGTKYLDGKIGDTELKNIFEYNSGDTTDSIYCLTSTKTTKFNSERYIKLSGDLSGGLRNTTDGGTTFANGSSFIKTSDPENTDNVVTIYNTIEGFINVEQYIPTNNNNLSYYWLNSTTNSLEFIEHVTESVSEHLNAVEYFVFKIPTEKFTKVDGNSYFQISPNVSNISDYNKYKNMNAVINYDHKDEIDGTDTSVCSWKLYCYTNTETPDITKLKIQKFGKIVSKN